MSEEKPFEPGQRVVCEKSDLWVYLVNGKPVEDNRPVPVFKGEYTVEYVEHPVDTDGTARDDLWAVTLLEFPHIFGSEDLAENNIYNARHFRATS